MVADYEHTACGILPDASSNTKFRCFDGEANTYQECDMLHEYTFPNIPVPFCLPGYIPPPPPGKK